MFDLIDSCPVNTGLAKIVQDFRVKALIDAIKALATEYNRLNKQYNESIYLSQACRQYNRLVRNDATPIGTELEYRRMQRLSERRALLTKLCTESEIDYAISQAK